MSGCLRTCAVWIITIPLMLVVLCLLIATIGLAVKGIDLATESNTCLTSNATTNCLPEVSALSPLVNGVRSPQHRIVEGANPAEYLYWLAGATACGILFAFFATFGLCFLEYAIYRVRKSSSDHTDHEGGAIQLQEMGSGASPQSPHGTSPSPPPEIHLDTLESEGTQNIVMKPPVKLRKLIDKGGIGALFMLFFSLVFFILAVLALLWSVAIGYNFSRATEREVYPFVVVELLVCIIFPVFLFIAGILMAVVLDYVTYGALDGRHFIPRLLRNVKFEKGKESDFWIIVNSFYFTLKKPKGDGDAAAKAKQIGCGVCYSCFPNFATWIIAALAGLCLILAVSYFADRTIDTQITVTSCEDPGVDRDFSCFNASTLAYVDCVTDTNTVLLHCFKFYQFGVDVDIISSIASSFAFYLVAVSSITTVFGVMQILLHLHHSKIWGAFFVAFGFVALTAVIAVVIIWATGYIEAALPELPRLNIVNLAQLIMVCCFIILVGILIVTSTWVEKIPSKGKKSENKDETAARSLSPIKV